MCEISIIIIIIIIIMICRKLGLVGSVPKKSKVAFTLRGPILSICKARFSKLIIHVVLSYELINIFLQIF